MSYQPPREIDAAAVQAAARRVFLDLFDAQRSPETQRALITGLGLDSGRLHATIALPMHQAAVVELVHEDPDGVRRQIGVFALPAAIAGECTCARCEDAWQAEHGCRPPAPSGV